jgi:hypothetical protein
VHEPFSLLQAPHFLLRPIYVLVKAGLPAEASWESGLPIRGPLIPPQRATNEIADDFCLI